MSSFLIPALLGFYIGVLIGFDPIIALAGAVYATLTRATLAAVLYDHDSQD